MHLGNQDGLREETAQFKAKLSAATRSVTSYSDDFCNRDHC